MTVGFVKGAYDSSVPDGRKFPTAKPRVQHQHHCAAAASADDESTCAINFVMSEVAFTRFPVASRCGHCLNQCAHVGSLRGKACTYCSVLYIGSGH